MRPRAFMVAAALAVAGLAAAANADVLAQWTFETSAPVTAGPFPAELGLFGATSLATGGHVAASLMGGAPGVATIRAHTAYEPSFASSYEAGGAAGAAGPRPCHR